MFQKSSDLVILGTVSLVNASISRLSPGTAADKILFGPSAERISPSSFGYASISHTLLEFGTRL